MGGNGWNWEEFMVGGLSEVHILKWILINKLLVLITKLFTRVTALSFRERSVQNVWLLNACLGSESFGIGTVASVV